MGELYEAHHEEDMFMYFAYADHDPFGTDWTKTYHKLWKSWIQVKFSFW